MATTRLNKLTVRTEQYSVAEAWQLLEWCVAAGATEFTLRCLATRSSGSQFCDQVDQTLRADSQRAAKRPHLSRALNELGIRETKLWILNEHTLKRLRGLVPAGIFDYAGGRPGGWLENLEVYRDGEILLGVITHEHRAVLFVTDDERDQLQALHLLQSEPRID